MPRRLPDDWHITISSVPFANDAERDRAYRLWIESVAEAREPLADRVDARNTRPLKEEQE